MLGGAIVIAYNVFHVIPNEVPILFVIGLISLRLRDGGWSTQDFGGLTGLPGAGVLLALSGLTG